MKKILLGLGSVAVIAAPVALVVSCGSDDKITGVTFSTENGKVKITVDGTGITDKIVLIDKIEAAAKQQGITLPSNEGEIFGLIDLTTSTNIVKSLQDSIEYFASSPEHFSRTPSTGQHTSQPQTQQTTQITITDIISVDLTTDSITDLKTKFGEFKVKYDTSDSRFAIKFNDGTKQGIMVFMMNAGTDRQHSFMRDTVSYGNYDITVEGQTWTWDYRATDGTYFFDTFEPAWIAKINADTPTDTSDDVTQFDWSSSHP